MAALGGPASHRTDAKPCGVEGKAAGTFRPPGAGTRTADRSIIRSVHAHRVGDRSDRRTTRARFTHGRGSHATGAPRGEAGAVVREWNEKVRCRVANKERQRRRWIADQQGIGRTACPLVSGYPKGGRIKSPHATTAIRAAGLRVVWSSIAHVPERS